MRKGFPPLKALQVPTLPVPKASGEARGGAQESLSTHFHIQGGPWVHSLSNKEPESHLQ